MRPPKSPILNPSDSMPGLSLSDSPLNSDGVLLCSEVDSSAINATASPSVAPRGSVIPSFEPIALSGDEAPHPTLGVTPESTSVNAAVGSSGATPGQVREAINAVGLGATGQGITVGVLSDSFNELGGAAQDEASGALPPASDIKVLKEDPYSGGTDEGRAMMQVVHDIAPGANLDFYTADVSEQDFANGILALAAAGAKVIVDDVTYFDEPFFQTGVIANAIQTVEQEGAIYVTSAGNDAGNGYQAAWNPITLATFDGTVLRDTQNFGGNNPIETIVIGGQTNAEQIPFVVEWNQPYGSVTSHIEVLVFRNGSLFGTATNSSSGEPNNPYIQFDLPSGYTYQIAIENLSGPNPGLIGEVAEGDGWPVTINVANAGTVLGHHMSPYAITVGAVSAASTPAFGGTLQSEFFSSSGSGTELWFNYNGTASANGPLNLSPVALSGVDDINTTVSDLTDFYGTSAAAPTVAAVVADMLQENPTLTFAQVEQILEESATPFGNSTVAGAGLLDAAEALQAVAPPSLVHEGSISVAVGATATIPESQLQFDDSLSTHAQETYTVITAPVDGSLLKNGLVTSSFTQADIDNGLIVYQETANNVSSDSFVFKVTDAAGNTTTAQQFQFQILPPPLPDLTVNSLTLGTTSIIQGGSTTVSYHMENDGNATAGASVSKIYLSTDNLITTSDTVLASINDGSLQNGIYSSDSTSITLPSGLTPVTYWIGVIADANAQVSESNENNNASSPIQITVTSPDVPPSVTATTVEPAYPEISGNVDEWILSNGQWLASAGPGSHPAGYQVAGVGDFNHDGTSDILWYNSGTGDVDEWDMSNGGWLASVDLGSHPGSGWQIAGTGDFNGDGISDVLWFNAGTGQTDIWELVNGKWTASVSPGSHPAGYQVAGIGDFNHDGTSDVLWYNPSTGDVDEWKIVNGQWAGSVDLGLHPGSGWQIGGVGDFNGDGTSDVLWFNSSTDQTDIWELSNGQWAASASPGSHPTGYQAVGIGDFNGDGTSDVLFYNPATGDVDEWKISNGHWAGSVDLGLHPGSGWQVAGIGDFNHDGTSDVLWHNSLL